MTDERRSRIAQISWARRALQIRDSFKTKLVVLGEYEFLDYESTIKIGQQFWEYLDNIEYIEPEHVERMLRLLKKHHAYDQIYWLHRFTNDAGLIVVNLGALLANLSVLKDFFGPDILLAGVENEFGLCMEQDESGIYLRCWGSNL